MLKTIVKLSNIDNLSDARYAAGMGVEMLGFSMDTLPIERFNEIKGWVAGVQIVGETTQTDIAQIETLVAQYKPAILQVTNDSLVPALKTVGLPIILRLDFSEHSIADLQQILQSNKANITYFLLENSDVFAHLEPDTLQAIDQLAFQHPVLLGFGLNAVNVSEVLAQTALSGIALLGGEEIRPGYRDFGDTMDLLEAIEED
jgi:phosphoribosylanthranilate isomerase